MEAADADVEPVRRVRADDAVRPLADDEHVGAVAADQRVVAGAAVEGVVAGAAVEGVVAEAAEQRVVAVIAVDLVVALVALDDVVAGVGVDDVLSFEAGDGRVDLSVFASLSAIADHGREVGHAVGVADRSLQPLEVGRLQVNSERLGYSLDERADQEVSMGAVPQGDARRREERPAAHAVKRAHVRDEGAVRVEAAQRRVGPDQGGAAAEGRRGWDQPGNRGCTHP